MEKDWDNLLGPQQSEPTPVERAAMSFYRWAKPGSSWAYTNLYVAYSKYCKARGEKRASEYFWAKALREVGMQYSCVDRRRRWIKPSS